MSGIASILPIVGGLLGAPAAGSLGALPDIFVNGTDPIQAFSNAALDVGTSVLGANAGSIFGPIAGGGESVGALFPGGGSYAADAFGTAGGYGGVNAPFNIPLIDSASTALGGAGGLGGFSGGGSYSAENFGTAAGYGGENAAINIPGATPGANILGPGGTLINSPSGGQNAIPSFISGAGNAIDSFGKGVSSFLSPVTSSLPKISPQVRQGLGLASAGMSLYSGYEGMKEAKEMRRRSDEYDTMLRSKLSSMASNRPSGPSKYRTQLDSLMADPSSLERTPGYTAGLQALERRLAAQGFTGSGNAKASLLKYGGDAYNQQVDQLRRMAEFEESGQLASSSNEAQLISQFANGRGQAANLRGQGLASIGYGVRGLGY